MTFLKKLGQVLLKIAGVATGIIPLIAPLIPGAAAPAVITDVSNIAGVIVTVEQMFAAAYGTDAKMGSDKLKAAVPFVSQIIQHTAPFAGKSIKNQPLFTQAVTQITSSFADLLNSLGD